MLRVPDRPEDGQGEYGVRTCPERAAGPVTGGEKGERTALLQAGGENHQGFVRAYLFPGQREVARMSVMERIIFRNDAQNAHAFDFSRLYISE